MRIRYGSKYFRLAFCAAGFFLIATAALLTIINRHNDASAVAVNPDIWNLEIGYYDSTVNNGNTFLTDSTWHRAAEDRNIQERRRITFQINYSADSIDRDYNTNQLVIKLPLPLPLANYASETGYWNTIMTNDLGTTYSRNVYAVNSEIAASTNYSTDFDWRYICEKAVIGQPHPNCYFYNNKPIQQGTSFRGSIQIVYDVYTQPSAMAALLFQTEFQETNGFDVTATLNDTVESNHAKLTYIQDAAVSYTKEKYSLGIISSKLDSLDGFGADANNYTWVHYYYYGAATYGTRAAADQKYEDPYDGPGSVPDDNYLFAQSYGLIPVRQWEWTDAFSNDVVVLDSHKNPMSRNSDNKFVITQSPAINTTNCKYTPNGYSSMVEPKTCYEVYVGYPKNLYNAELGTTSVTANGVSKGTYFQSETEEVLATASKLVNLSEFSIEYHGNDIGFTKTVSPTSLMNGNGSSYSVNADQFKTSDGATIYYLTDTKALNVSSKPYTIVVGDDILFHENVNDGVIEQLDENDYSFTELIGDYYPIVMANGTSFTCEDHSDFKIYYRLRGEDQYRPYTFQSSDYAKPCGKVREGNLITYVHWSLPEGTVGWKAVLPNLDEGVLSYRLQTAVNIKSDNLPDHGKIHNFAYINVIDNDDTIVNPAELSNYGAGVTQQFVATYDQSTYGRYQQRAFSSYEYGPFELGPVIHNTTAPVGHSTPTYVASSDSFEGRASLGISAEYYTLNRETNWEVIQRHIQPEDWLTNIEAYYLLPRGQEILSTADEIAHSVTSCNIHDNSTSTWQIPQSHPFRNQAECNAYIASHTTVVITKNWHNSGRVHIKIHIDFSEKPISLINQYITLAWFTARTRIPYDIYVANEALSPNPYEYGIVGYAFQDGTYQYDPENIHNTNPTPDNGHEGFYIKADYLGTPALPVDINDNGNTTEELYEYSQPFRMLGAVSVEQSVRETLWTDQTNAFTTDDSYVSAGGDYKHRLAIRTGASRATNVVVYDNLETAYEDNEHWQGSFNGVDTSYADGQTDQNGKTIKVKTYYSTSATAGTLEADPSNWHEYIEGTTDKSIVKSIAFEYLTTENTPAVIAASSYIYTTINMLAPTDEESNIFAYNKFTSYWTDINSVSNAVEGSQTLTSNTTRAQIDNKITIHVVKEWDDFNNKYQTRPNTVTPTLRRGSELIDNTSSINITLGESTLDYPDLHEYYKDDYDVTLSPITNYDTVRTFDPDTLTYTFRSTLKTTDITVQTIWIDNNDAYNLRPDSVDYILKQGNTTDSTKAMDIAGHQNSLQFDTIPTHLFNNFTVAQEDLSNYSTRLEVSDDGHTYTFINTLNATFDVTINHEWVDESNARNLRPDSVTYTLNKSDVAEDTTTATSASWTTGFQSLPLLGRDSYDIPDVTVARYGTTKSCVDGTNHSIVCTFTSTLEDNLDINIIHNWVDANNAYQTRPASVTYQLQKSNVNDQTTTSNANWTADFTNLHMPDQAQYSVVTPTIADYDTTVEVSADGKTYTFTSTLTKTYDIAINHVWVDESNTRGLRPPSTSYNLLNGNTTEDNTTATPTAWTTSFQSLPLLKRTDYSVQNEAIDHYSTTKSCVDGANNSLICTFTSTLEDNLDINIIHQWVDADNAYQTRPASVTYQLQKSNVNDQTTTSNANWTADFTNLHMPDQAQYSVVTPTIADYDTTVEVSADGKTYTFTSTLAKTFNITINHEWVDESNTRGLRPPSTSYNLLNGNTTENTTTATPTAWTTNFNNLPLLNRSSYAVDNNPVAHYGTTKSCVDGENNSIVCTFTSTLEDNLDIHIVHNWIDADNAYSTRPTDVTYQLKKGNTNDQTTTSNANWTADFTNLHAPDQAQYSVVTPTITGYDTTVEISADGKTYTFTSTLTKTINVIINHSWIDNDNERGLRPPTISHDLKKNNTTAASASAAPNSWSTSFNGLPLLDKTQYSVPDITVAHYDTSKNCADDANFNLVCNFSHSLEDNLDIHVQHVWVDANNAYSTRPTDVTYQLKKGNTNDQTATSNASWTADFTNLHAPDQAQYSVVTPTIADYDTTVEISNNGKTYTFTSTLTKTFNVVVNQTWDDDNNARGLRPDSTSYNLKKGNQTEDTKSIDATANGSTTFQSLPLLDKTQYSIPDITVDRYATAKSCADDANFNLICNFTSTLEDNLDIKVVQIWDDQDNSFGLRPTGVNYTLQKSGSDVTIQAVNSDNSWTTTFKNLHMPDKTTYAVPQVAIDGYNTDVAYDPDTNTYTFTSTLITVPINVKHIWDDNDNSLDTRPDEVNSELTRGDNTEATHPVDTDQNEDEFIIAYIPPSLIDEYLATILPIDYYNTDVAHDPGTNTYTFTSTLTPAEINVRNIWIDNNNARGIRPASLDFNLDYNDDTEDTYTLETNQNSDEFTFDGLIEFKLRNYNVALANEVAEYTTDVDYDATTNTYTFTHTILADPEAVNTPNTDADNPLLMAVLATSVSLLGAGVFAATKRRH